MTHAAESQHPPWETTVEPVVAPTLVNERKARGGLVSWNSTEE